MRAESGHGEWERNEGDLSAPHSVPWETMHVTSTDGDRSVALRCVDYGLWLRKTVTLSRDDPRMTISYAIENPGRYPIDVLFVSEWNIGLPGPDGSPGWEQIRPPYEDPNIEPTLFDAGGAFGLTVLRTGFSEVWEQRINTVTSSEKGVELSYQGLSLAFTLPVKLNPSEAIAASLRWDVVTHR